MKFRPRRRRRRWTAEVPLFLCAILTCCNFVKSAPKNWLLHECEEAQDCPSDMICSNYNDRCMCEDQENTTYDYKKEFCARKVGKSCEGQMKGNLTCVSNAVCDPMSNICVCPGPKYSEKRADGTCLMHYDMSCDNNKLCNPEKYFKCSDKNQCECVSPEEQVYSDEHGSCVALPGHRCESFESDRYFSGFTLNCGFHAKCQYISDSAFEDPNQLEICICNVGYLPQPNSPNCMPNLNSSCSAKDPCIPGHNLQCNLTDRGDSKSDVGICTCDSNAAIVTINQTPDHCALRVGSHCDSTSTCIPGSICVQSKCQCKYGYAVTPEGKCKLGYYHWTCEDDDECNEVQGLVCANTTTQGIKRRTCLCPKNQNFDQNLQRCVIPVGSNCKLNTEAELNMCDPNAFCDKNLQECICKESYSPSFNKPDGHCYPALGAPCNSSEQCSGGQHLICGSNEICECNHITRWEQNATLCFSLVGEGCDSNIGDTCVSHAVCESGICQCTKGFYKKRSDGKCGLEYEKQCEPGENDCNFDEFLKCVFVESLDEHLCRCSEDWLIYDYVKESCVISNGLHCNVTSDGPTCGLGSVCVNVGSGHSNSEFRCECDKNFHFDIETGLCVTTKSETFYEHFTEGETVNATTVLAKSNGSGSSAKEVGKMWVIMGFVMGLFITCM